MGATISTILRYNRLEEPDVNLSEVPQYPYSNVNNSSVTLQNLRYYFTGFWTRLKTSTVISSILSVALALFIIVTVVHQWNGKQSIKIELEKESDDYTDLLYSVYHDSFYKHLAVDQNTSEKILSSMNTSVDPCNDFYQFTCQGWSQKNPRPEYSPDWTVFHILTEKSDKIVTALMEAEPESSDIPAYKLAQNFYKSCIKVEKQDSEEDEKLLNFVWDTLEMYGGWPILYGNGTWNSTNFSWIKSMTALSKRFKTTTILDIFSSQDRLGRLANNTIVVTAPSSASGKRGYRGLESKETDFDHLTTSRGLLKGSVDTRNFIVNASKILLKFKGKNNFDEAALQRQATAMMKMEGELAAASTEATTSIELMALLGVHEKNLGKMTLEELQEQIDDSLGRDNSVQFREILELLYKPAGIRIAPSENLTVVDVDYVLGILKYVQQADAQTLANLLHYKMLAYMMPMLTKDFRELIEKRRENIDGSAESAPRREVCAQNVKENFKFAVGQKIVARQYKNMNEFKNVRTEIKEMFSHIRDTLKRYRTSLNSYLEDRILTTLIGYTEICVGFPDWLFDSEKVQQRYVDLHLDPLTTYLEQTLTANEWVSDNQLKKLRLTKDVGACEWKRFPGEVGAFTDWEQFRLYFPLGILQKPFFQQGQSLALNYGSMGSVIGHELTHAFSRFGWEKSKSGSLTMQANCLVDQYNNFSLSDSFPGQHISDNKNLFLSGKKTVDENFADNGGIALAYKAFKAEESSRYILHHLDTPLVSIGQQNYTTDQLFFIGFAQNWCETSTINGMRLNMQTDVHSPGFYRVFGTLENSKEFAAAWHCPIGSKMNSGREKCSLLEIESDDDDIFSEDVDYQGNW